MRRMLSAAIAPAAIAVVLATEGSGIASASCGSAACFLVTQSERSLASQGVFRVDLSFRYVDQTRKLEGSHGTLEVLVPAIDFEDKTIVPDHHREISTRNTTLEVAAAYGVTARLTIFGIAPLLVDKGHEHFDDVGTPQEHFTNADGTRGFGDIALGARYAFIVRADDMLLASLSAKLPTGPYKLLDSDGAINEPTIQPGTGSFDGTLAVQYVHHAFPSSREWFASGSYRANGRNSLDYRLGDDAIVSAGLEDGSGRRWTWSVQMNARHARRDDYLGMGVPSTGSRSLTVTPGVRFRASSGTEIYGYLQVPVYQRENEAQLAPRAGFVLGVARSF